MVLDIYTVEWIFVVGPDGTLSVSGRAESQSHKWGPGCGGVNRAGFFEPSKIRQTLIQTLDKPGALRYSLGSVQLLTKSNFINVTQGNQNDKRHYSPFFQFSR